MANEIRALLLKREARRHLEAYRSIADGYSCGIQMLQHISADAAEHARKFDEAMDSLRAIDPNCPTHRLSA